MHDPQKQFIPDFQPSAKGEDGWVLAFIGRNLLLRHARGRYDIPTRAELRGLPFTPARYIGHYDGHRCFCARTDTVPALPDGLVPVELADVSARTGDPGLFLLAGTANQLLHWGGINRFCGRCGHEMEDKTDERAKICPACGNIVYPRISPATITAIFRGDEILLAHNAHFKGDMYGLIAGFVEPGETLEQCVVRETHEEVGIDVSDIRYLSSQPWPFPDSLMMAFTAEYAGGELKADGDEIAAAAWFCTDSLPNIPSPDSIAGRIIRRYRDGRLRAR